MSDLTARFHIKKIDENNITLNFLDLHVILSDNIIINDASEKIKLLGDLGKLLRIEKIN